MALSVQFFTQLSKAKTLCVDRSLAKYVTYFLSACDNCGEGCGVK
jgi:hypothetical protein